MAKKHPIRFNSGLRLATLVATLILSACDFPPSTLTPASPSPTQLPTLTASPSEAATPVFTPTPILPNTPSPSPTPDPPRAPNPNLDSLGPGWGAFAYKVEVGEDLGLIAARYGVSYDQIRAANGFTGGETLLPGQIILIPQIIQEQSPALKLISDSELVYGPGAVGFDVIAFVAGHKRGYLFKYSETINGEEVGGAELIQRAAQNYSVNPRLLLALLEHQSGWLTQIE
ncbi:MAG TPA: LysM domain-containing protein, partial [Anaerolineales bacterium]|nr:LysM domain-containing protein [Anaerolineales bacterium]